MGEDALAEGKKNAARLSAAMVFLDEASFLMAPLARRSWSLRGQTPVLVQRTRSHRKVGVIAALCVSPKRDRVRLFFRLYPDANIRAMPLVAFVRELRRALGSPIVLVWDRLPAHRGKAMAAYAETDRRLHCVLLPPYAPELNPVEYVFGHLKMNPWPTWRAPESTPWPAWPDSMAGRCSGARRCCARLSITTLFPCVSNRTLIMRVSIARTGG